MRELPRGTVTLLFTDIEGSTRLLHDHGRDAYVRSLQLHRAALREVLGGSGGVEVEMQGDSFFFGFQSAGDAVVAAAEAQRRLGDLDWQAGPPITVRIGIHTGEPTVSDSLYAGLDVHRAARVMAAAHGGQVLLSARTADLVGGDLPDDLRLRPLGRYMLKDFAAGEPLAQVEGAGLEARFPRLRAERQPSRVLRGVPRPVRRHPLVFSALIAALVAAVAVPLSLIGPPPIEFQANALAELDAHSGKRVAVVPVGDTPSAVAAAGRDLWVANAGEATISRIDTKLGRVVRTIPVGGTPVGITVGAGAAWVLNSDLAATKSTVSRVDLRYSQVTARIALPPSQLIGSGAGISWDGRDIWAATQAGSVFRISPRTERVLDSVAAGNDPISLAPAAGSVWVANRRNATVIRVEAPATITATVPVGQQPTAIAAGAGALWVADAGEDAVRRIDPRTGSVVATIHVGRQPETIAASSTSVWVGNSRDRSVMRIDPRTNRVTKTVRVDYAPAAIAISGGRVWVALQQALPEEPTAVHGQTLHLLTSAPGIIDSLDPPLAYTPITWQIEYATCARLYNHPDAAPPRGYRIVPEIASELPRRLGDGRTYTIPIRRGFRFSPPSNQVVTARTFKYSIERALAPQTKSFARNFLTDIVGVDAYQAGKARHISGLSVRGTELLIRLVHPAGSLAARLAMPFFCPVPIGTPRDFKGLTNIPSAGPYSITSYVPNKRIILRRNPNYHGARPRRSGTIEITPRPTEADAVHAVEANRADAILDATGREPIPTRYASREVRVPLPTVRYLALNASRPLFRDARVRRAVALAIDRAAVVRSDRDLHATETLLPPGFPGVAAGDYFMPHGDVAKARRLLRGRQLHGVYFTCNRRECILKAAEVIRELERVGIGLKLRTMSDDELFLRTSARGATFDVTDAGWFADYVHADDFLRPLMTSEGIKTTQSSNVSYFDQPSIHVQLREAAQRGGAAGRQAYERIERHLRVDEVPYVALASDSRTVLVSKRIGCRIANPVYGLDLGALCIKHR